MNINAVIFAIVLVLSLLTQAKAQQQLIILKDSVQIGEQYYVLEEPKLANHYSSISMEIYQKIRNKSIMGSYFSATPEQRLKAKKESLIALMVDSRLREAAYGFEHYELFYNQAGLLNLSVNIQSYGSPFESRQAYSFDLATGKVLGKALFIHHKGLLKMVSDKLKEQKKGFKLNLDALDQYEIVNHKGMVEGIKFLITDTQNYRNSGYEVFEVDLTSKEIASYVSPVFKQRLKL